MTTRGSGTPGRAAVGLVLLAVTVTGCSSTGATPGGNGTYPPSTLSGAEQLAGTGDAATLHLIRTENRPWQSCKRPNYYATVDQGVAGRRLAADELAFFVARYGLTSKCPAYLYVFHNAAQADQPGYTAGAVILDEVGLEVHTEGLPSAPAFTIKPQ